MSETIIVSIISLVGTLLGTLGGILASQKLTSYRISQLEQKVDKHNNLIDRMYKVESKITLVEQELNEIKENL